MSHFQHLALCRDEDPELFFPVGTSGPALLQLAEAKAVCRRCPVREECLAEGVRVESYGVWGGQSEDERAKRKLRPARDRIARRAASARRAAKATS